jgi:transposase-like protein
MAVSFYDLIAEIPDEKSAERYFIEQRWPGGRVACPECGSGDVLRGRQKKRRRQLWYCHGCKHQFSVTSGTIMESTKLPLRKWILAYHIMGASKKGVSCRQLARMLHTTPKTAWHLCHRIRETMGFDIAPFTGVVETDELYVGGRRKGKGRGYRGNKVAVQTIVRRSDEDEHNSKARTISLNRPEVDGRTLGAKLRTNTDPPNTILMSDQNPSLEGWAGHSPSITPSITRRRSTCAQSPMGLS